MRIIVVHSGPIYEAFPLTSLLIGLNKEYPPAKILWVSDPDSFELIKFNKRANKHLDINKCYDLASLTDFYGAEVCINASSDMKAKKFTTLTNAKQVYGFSKDGPANRDAEFFQNVMNGDSETNKTILELYYNLAGLKWRGEGYGLSYYPRLKQSKGLAVYLNEEDDSIEGERLVLPDNLFAKFDTINQYSDIITDDLFVTHAALSLRKKVSCLTKVPYRFNFMTSSKE